MTAKFAAITAAIATALVAFLLSAYIINGMEKDHVQALVDARAAERAECKQNAELTEEVSREYQKDLASTRRDLAHAKRMFRATPCVPIAPIARGHSGATPATRELHRADGVDPGALLDFSGDCEQCRVQLKSCQSFIRQVWERAG